MTMASPPRAADAIRGKALEETSPGKYSVSKIARPGPGIEDPLKVTNHGLPDPLPAKKSKEWFLPGTKTEVWKSTLLSVQYCYPFFY